MDRSSLVSPCLNVVVGTDHDGRAWKWSYLPRLDEAYRPFYGHGIFLP